MPVTMMCYAILVISHIKSPLRLTRTVCLRYRSMSDIILEHIDQNFHRHM